jgi:hypothetical protein
VAERLDLARDVLDKLLVDQRGREFGRVDGVLIHLRQGRPPRVGELEVGLYTVMRRVNTRFGEWLAGVIERVSPVSLKSALLPFDHFNRKGARIVIPISAEEDDRLMPGEKWLRENVIKKLPGGGK